MLQQLRTGVCILAAAWLVVFCLNRPALEAAESAAPSSPTAVSPTPRAPRTAAQDARSTIWDGVFTDTQAKRGEEAYAKSCAKCHAEDLLGSTNAPPLVGQAFFARFDRTSADDVVDVIRRTMPQEAPDTLGMETYADIVSFMLKSNGAPAGKADLSTDRPKLREILVTSK